MLVYCLLLFLFVICCFGLTFATCLYWIGTDAVVGCGVYCLVILLLLIVGLLLDTVCYPIWDLVFGFRYLFRVRFSALAISMMFCMLCYLIAVTAGLVVCMVVDCFDDAFGVALIVCLL